MKTGLALDRTARTIDAQGFLHVKDCNISKACVNPYWGSEIPDAAELGLKPDVVYHLLRDPKELEKAAASFNNLPLMDFHTEVSATNLEDGDAHDKVVGTTGGNAHYEHPFLINDIVVWTAGAIEGINSKQQTELSCAYRYKLDMTPGEFEGQKYDGRMYDIVGNHVALVDEGRAGKDVTVKDRKPQGITDKLMVKIDFSDVIKVLQDASAKVAAGGPEVINPVIDELTKLKALITEKLKPGADEETAKALDDCTAAIDIAVHHLLDVKEDDAEAAVGGVTTEDDSLDETGGVTEEADDANPEGHNQYTGAHTSKAVEASKSANEATRASKDNRSSRNHEAAANAHAKAAQAHRAARAAASASGNKEAEAHHDASYFQHRDASNYHQQMANRLSARGDEKPGGIHVEDANPEGHNQYTAGLGAAKTHHEAMQRHHEKKHSELVHKATHGGVTEEELGKLQSHKHAAQQHREAAANYNYALRNPHPDGTRSDQHHTLKGWSNAANTASSKANDEKPGGVSVEDANPEGKNQYTGGGGGEGAKKDAKSQARMHTNAAVSATAVANSSGSKEDHLRAMKAHEKAKESNRAAGNHKQADLHSSHVVYHDRESSPVQKSRIFNYTNGKDANPQGVNQYTGGGGSNSKFSYPEGVNKHELASQRASKASRNAETAEGQSKSKYGASSYPPEVVAKHHAIAAEAHQEASKQHKVMGNQARADHHASEAAYHQKRSQVPGKDANPQGINQYTGGGSSSKSPSAVAGSFSARAIKSGDPAHHDEASAAHAHAATKAASPAVKSWHESMANAHEAASRGVPVKFGKNFGDTPKVSSHKGGDMSGVNFNDANPEGINQYTGGGSNTGKGTLTGRASIKAESATAKANKAPTPANHRAAELAHAEAAKMHAKLGNPGAGAKHRAAAIQHRMESLKPRGAEKRQIKFSLPNTKRPTKK